MEDDQTGGDGNFGDTHRTDGCPFVGGVLIAILNAGARDGRVPRNGAGANGVSGLVEHEIVITFHVGLTLTHFLTCIGRRVATKYTKAGYCVING